MTQLRTQVAVTRFDVVHELVVASATPNGLFLEGDVGELPEFTMGAEVSVRLFDEHLDESTDVLAMARVVHVVRGQGRVASGVALRFTEIEDGDRAGLETLLGPSAKRARA